MAAPEIFDRNARRLRRDRCAGAPEAFFVTLIIDELLERLATITRPFQNALLIGAEPRLAKALEMSGIAVTIVDPSSRRAALLGGEIIDEDRDSFTAARFDLVIACGTLDSVADVPGALILWRQALQPDGVFLGAFAGAVSLPTLRAAAVDADVAQGQAVARFHPQIDVRAAGDLLVRAGFALPVADRVDIALSYTDVGRLIDDLRAAAMTNVLATRYPVTREWRRDLATAFSRVAAADGRTHDTLSLIVLTGWAPAPSQPRPARRGSATAALAHALKQRL